MKTNAQLLQMNKEAMVKGIFPTNIAFTPEEAERFLTNVVDLSFLKNNARVVMMKKEKKEIRWLGPGTGKVLHPAATFDQSKYKTLLTHEKIQLSVEKARGCVVVPDDDLEDNIEGEAFVNHLMDGLIAPKISNEIEEMCIIGDKVSPPTDLNEMLNGWYTLGIDSAAAGDGEVLKKTVVYDASADPDPYVAISDADSPYGWKFKFRRMWDGLHAKYKKLKNDLRYVVSQGVYDDYEAAIAARVTSVGDRALIEGAVLKFKGIPVVAVPLVPEDLGTGSDETFAMLTFYNNFILGLHRSLRMETERSAPDEATRFWFSIRADTELENTEALVIYKKMKVRGA